MELNIKTTRKNKKIINKKKVNLLMFIFPIGKYFFSNVQVWKKTLGVGQPPGCAASTRVHTLARKVCPGHF